MVCMMNGMTTRLILALHILLLLCFPLNATEQQAVTAPLLSQTSGLQQTESPLSREFPPEAFLTTGIVLAFHEWPDEEEKAGILRDAGKAGLQKEEEELQYTKVWFFTWTDQKPRNSIKAHWICRTFSSLSTLRYCRPMYVGRPKEVL